MQNRVNVAKYVIYVKNIPSCRLAEWTSPSLSGSIVWITASDIVGNLLKGMSYGLKSSWINAWLSINRTQKNISHMIYLTLATACIKWFPELIDSVSEVAKANVSETDRVNLEALVFITCRLCKPNHQNMSSNTHYMQNMQNM